MVIESYAKSICRLAIITNGLLLSSCGGDVPRHSETTRSLFQKEIVDDDGGAYLWGKGIGDLNGDGRPDILVGGNRAKRSVFDRVLIKFKLKERKLMPRGSLIWYESPDWRKHTISTDYKVRMDLEVTDVDGDGLNDILLLSDEGFFWLENPSWNSHLISPLKLHDVEVIDLDGDQDLDIVARNQSLFGDQTGNFVHLYRREFGVRWHHFSIAVPPGEGLGIGDLNTDGYPDIVVNEQWLMNPGDLTEQATWTSFQYATNWKWEDVCIAVEDINNDGRLDIFLAPAEEIGEFYKLSWYEAPKFVYGEWIEHLIEDNVEATHHSAITVDIDNDGDIDLITAEVIDSVDPDEIKVYLNDGNGRFTKSVFDDVGSYNLRAADLDNDHDIDLIGTNWRVLGRFPRDPVRLWRNTSSD